MARSEMIELSARADRGRGRRRGHGRRRRAGGPERAVVDSREAAPRGPVLRPAGRARRRGRVRRAGARGRGLGRRGRGRSARAPWRAPQPSAAGRGGGWVLARARSARRAPGARSRLAARARLPGRRDHRVGGQDVGQGHLPRDPAAAGPRQPGELQHRDRPAAGGARRPAGDARRWCWRWRCAAAGRSPSCARSPSRTSRAITNIGPVHLELLGTLEAIAEAKAEILAELGERGRAVVPADAEALEPHLHDRLVTITFGPGGDVFALASGAATGARSQATIGTPARRAALLVPVRRGAQPHQRPGGDRDRRGARGAAGRDGAAGAGDNLLAPARRADRAGRRNRRS